MIFGQEIDRLNLVVKDITGKFDIAEQRNRDLEARLNAANREYAMLQSQMSGSAQDMHQNMKRIS